MNMEHVTLFLDGMHARAPEALGGHLSHDVVLNSPFVSTPFIGRDAVMSVLRVLLSAVDEFETTAIIPGEDRAAIMLRIRAGEAEVTGVDDMVVGGDGRITSMTIQWRPLQQVVQLPQKLAPLIGVAALRLVESETA